MKAFIDLIELTGSTKDQSDWFIRIIILHFLFTTEIYKSLLHKCTKLKQSFSDTTEIYLS